MERPGGRPIILWEVLGLLASESQPLFKGEWGLWNSHLIFTNSDPPASALAPELVTWAPPSKTNLWVRVSPCFVFWHLENCSQTLPLSQEPCHPLPTPASCSPTPARLQPHDAPPRLWPYSLATTHNSFQVLTFHLICCGAPMAQW